ncbi:PSD1 and planctomycete cytochrome C domain-containing protein [Akkermansiaceae bacterium]|nr:PSD1 and planctomycete cytochrome C domain-containing protein [Akkermansiaceae bacterium]MDA7933446.1 PSD1 and planctomycete cytochrome C domain-containing protein [Akkermansiaceae bacterium]MDB4423590.1 PSD1 and planctomycete cytochrome C domain-containing protein [bacterium]
MSPRFIFVSVFALSIAGAHADLDFNRDIRPILSANCFACHGPDEESREGKLRLDTAGGAQKAIKPADDPELLYRIETDDEDDLMPPPDSGHQLTGLQKELLGKWVAAGAPYGEHWSFQKPRKQAVPEGVHAIDHFVSKRLQKDGLEMSGPADRYALIRRLSLDLTGLPPTLEEAEEFQKSGDLNKAVDRLLASGAFGEHWARMWLDLARYADTKGYEKDRGRNIWRYRDWVIDALNADMPFDQFTTEQLAGDLLPNASLDQILATAFHRNTMENDEGGTDDEEFRVAAVKDRVDTTMRVWLGLTMGCAKCHTHKYDPISIKDYYSFYAFFNQTEDADRGTPVMATPTNKQQGEIKVLEAEVKDLEEKLKARSEEFHSAFAKWKTKIGEGPLWVPLRLHGQKTRAAKLQQSADGVLTVNGELPEKDTWILTFDLPAGQPVTALRIDAPTKKPGGKWKDKNVALRELTAELMVDGEEPRKLKLVNPRADFSQKGWDVAKAIDGSTEAGWAFSPRADMPHVAIFDFDKPIPGGKLRLTLEQEYGQGLIFETFQVSVSRVSSKCLAAEVDSQGGLESVFLTRVYEPTRKMNARVAEVLEKLEQVKRGIPKTPIMRELAANRRRVTRVHRRGSFLDQGEVVVARLPGMFGALPEGAPANRLGVARWLTHSENPLTARVMVNRIWARLFGKGIVETEEDFGTQGSVPTHPELLDWLAVDYQEQGWSLKQLLKTMVLSKTYQQSAKVTQDRLAKDPRNALLSRGARFRLSAEMVRDQALAASGLLTRELGGPSVMPPQPSGVWKSTYSGETWKNATGPDRYRRGVYTYLKRTSPYPAFTTFDAGSGEVCQIRRIRTNTPLQALITLNDTSFLEAAGALSKKMKDLEHGFRLVLIRPPSTRELTRLQDLYKTMKNHYQNNVEAAAELLKSAGLREGDAAMVSVANVLLNLDETLTKP